MVCRNTSLSYVPVALDGAQQAGYDTVQDLWLCLQLPLEDLVPGVPYHLHARVLQRVAPAGGR
jgi:hypothetical protein